MARVREEARALTINNSTAHSCAYLPSLARVCARSNSHRASRRAAGPDACHHGALCVPAGTLHHICQALAPSLLNPKLQDVRVVYFTSQDPRDVTNAIYLLGAFLCLRLGATPEEAWGPFQSLKDMSNGPLCLPYRDATWTKSSYDLHVKEYWAGLMRAVATGLYDLQTFDKHEVRCAPAVLCTSPRPLSSRGPPSDGVSHKADMRAVSSIFITMILRKVTCTWWCRVSFWPFTVHGILPTFEALFHRLPTYRSSKFSKCRRLCG